MGGAVRLWWIVLPYVAITTFVIGHMALYSEGPHGDADWSIRWRWS